MPCLSNVSKTGLNLVEYVNSLEINFYLIYKIILQIVLYIFHKCIYLIYYIFIFEIHVVVCKRKNLSQDVILSNQTVKTASLISSISDNKFF